MAVLTDAHLRAAWTGGCQKIAFSTPVITSRPMIKMTAATTPTTLPLRPYQLVHLL